MTIRGASAIARAHATHRGAQLARRDPEAQARHAAFLQGLQEWGWTAGRNVQIDYRWGAGDADRFRKYAVELVTLAPDVILATGSPVTSALLQATAP
jgi:putative ABC transport system substrate-binding protein